MGLEFVEPLVELSPVAVLDRLLPLRGQEAGQVADAVDDVNVEVGQLVERGLDLRSRGRAETLRGDDVRRGTLRQHLGCHSADPAFPPLLGMIRRLDVVAQVAFEVEVVELPLPRHVEATCAQSILVDPEQVLDVGRSGLGRPDV